MSKSSSSNLIKWLTILLALNLFIITGVADLFTNNAEIKETGSLLTYSPDSILIRYSMEPSESPDKTIKTSETANSAIGAETVLDFTKAGISGLQLVKIPTTISVPDAVLYYESLSEVLYAEPDYIYSIDLIPNDPEFSHLWGLSNTGQIFHENTPPGTFGDDISATSAWDITTGNRDATIAVVDTGVDYDHPDLAENIWTEAGTGIHGYNAINDNYDPMDDHYHGTHCAGIIGAVGNNKKGITGVNWKTSIMPVKCFDSFGNSNVSTEIKGILWAENHDADIISCSWGGYSYSKALNDCISETDAHFICSAGNNHTDNDKIPHYPSSFNSENIIAVSATDANDVPGSFSNYGKESVDLAAPGVLILSTVPGTEIKNEFWYDPISTPDNWTLSDPWYLSSERFESPPSCITINLEKSETGSSWLLMDTPVNFSGKKDVKISFSAVSEPKESATIIIETCVPGSSWKRAGEFRPDSDEFTQVSYNMPENYNGEWVIVRFRVLKNNTDSDALVWIDDLIFSESEKLYENSYSFHSGTSMAVPYVSGIAGLLKSFKPDITQKEIKEAVLLSVDQKESLSGLVLTEGRADAFLALDYLIPKPIPAGDIQMPVNRGWNFVSTPKKLSQGNNTAAIFRELKSGGHSVMRYEPEKGWISLKSNDIIKPLDGVWIYSQEPDFVNLSFEKRIIAVPPSKEIHKGWNTIGFSDINPASAKDSLLPSKDVWTTVIGFNSEQQIYETSIINQGKGQYSDGRMLEPFKGYWLYATGEGRISSVGI